MVLGSGGLKCTAALGLWKILAREGIDVDLLVGCSGGSLFAAGMALNWGLEEGFEISYRFAHEAFGAGNPGKRHWSSLLRTTVPWLLRFDERFGMFDDRRLMETLKWCYGDHTFADTNTPLRIVATDLHSCEQVIFSEGGLIDAIRASTCIPFIWPPHKIGERLFVDGAVSNPMPVDVAIKERCEIILAMGFWEPPSGKINSATHFAWQILSGGANNLFKALFALHSLAHHSEIIHIIPEFDRPVQLTDIKLIPSIIEAGERATEVQLPYICRLMEMVS